MKTSLLVLVALCATPALSVHAASTEFTYQGRLSDGGMPATGIYDLRFGIYDSPMVEEGEVRTNSAVNVSNGLFTVTLDFGEGIFNGEPRWLELGVRPVNSTNNFLTLTPRQRISPTPYAIYANGVNATGINGTISPANIRAGSITSSMLATGSVTSAQLAAGSVTTASIADDAVTAAKISTARIAPLALTFHNPRPDPQDYFSGSMAVVANNRILFGSPRDNTGAPDAGIAYMLDGDGRLLTTFTNPAPAFNEMFGNSVAAVGINKVIVGALNDFGNQGALHLFGTNGAWITTITNPLASVGNQFSSALATLGDSLLVAGAHREDVGASDSGVVHLFGTNGALLRTFTNPAPTVSGFFGYSLAAVGTDKLLIGAYNTSNGLNRAGAAYLFSTNGTLLSTFTNPVSNAAAFGLALTALGTDRVAIGAPSDDRGALDAGVVYVFALNGTLLNVVTNPFPHNGDLFGYAVATFGTDKLLVTAINDDQGGPNTSAVYLMSTNGALLTTMLHPSPNQGFMGFAIAPFGSFAALVSAPHAEIPAAAGGAAYLFNVVGPQMEYTSGLVSDGVRPGTITSQSLADGVITETKVDEALMAKLARLDANQTFTGTNIFAGVRARGGAPGPSGINNNGYAFSGNAGDTDSGMFSSADGQVEFHGNAIERMRIGANGNVAIGTTNTAYQLTVREAAHQIAVMNNADRLWTFSSTPNNSGLGIFENALANRLFLENGGFVGIGTENPSAPLHVVGSNHFPHLRVAAHADAPFGAFLSIDARDTAGGKEFLIFSTGAFAGEGQGKLIFQNHSDAVQVMALTAGGNVGIGTLAPATTLHVAGDATVSGNVRLGSNGAAFAAQSPESLRIVRGTVNAAGAIVRGSGFTATRNAIGSYTITFVPAFSDVPSVTATGVSQLARAGGTITSSNVTVALAKFDGVASDDTFHFIAAGPQ